MGFLAGKRALVVGAANQRSIAWGIAQAISREGAEVALTYQNDKLKERVEKLAQECHAAWTFPCDVSKDQEIENLAKQVEQSWDTVDILVHSLAFVSKEALEGDFVTHTSRENFQVAHDVSSYSLTALARALRPNMQKKGGAIVTVSYLGAERAIPNYNVMGLAKASLEANVRYLAYTLGVENIRVNAISAGPIKTLAASGIDDFRRMLDSVEQKAPLRRNITIQEVGNTAAFLCSELASGITGEVIYVDSGYHILGLA